MWYTLTVLSAAALDAYVTIRLCMNARRIGYRDGYIDGVSVALDQLKAVAGK